MNLHNFSSLYEILAGLNLAYAGSEPFRYGLNESILKSDSLISKIDARIEETNSKIQLTSIDETSPKTLDEIRSISSAFHKYVEVMKQRKKDAQKFTDNFRAMFLLSGLYCLYVLLMEGYNQFYEEKDPCLIPICLFWTNFLLIINVYIFASSYFKNLNKEIHYAIILLSFTAVVVISIYFYKKNVYDLGNKDEFVKGRTIITWSVLMAISPYILHIIKSLLLEIIYRIRLSVLIRQTKTKLNEASENSAEWRSQEIHFFDDKQDLKKTIAQAWGKFWVRKYQQLDPFFKNMSSDS